MEFLFRSSGVVEFKVLLGDTPSPSMSLLARLKKNRSAGPHRSARSQGPQQPAGSLEGAGTAGTDVSLGRICWHEGVMLEMSGNPCDLRSS